jgi:signal transduction histidine kinase
VANAQIVARLQQTQQQLVMQEKMASLGGLVAGVAHEVNTPLGICVTAASHLQLELTAITAAHQQRKLLVPEFERFLDTANTAALMLTQNTERAAALINSFKQVAVDKSAISLREFDVAEYLKEVVRSLQPELNRRQCQLQVISEPGITLYADAGSLAQLLTHLVMNSLQHGFSGVMKASAMIELKIVRTSAHIQLEYRDNGCGMNADTLKRLFDPFFTTKRSEGNSGLGAHIVYNLVTAQLNGSIYASSEPGQGLYYRILLPQLRRPD